MAIGALEPKFFVAFCERAGVPALANEGFTTGDRGREVTSELQAVFRSRTQAEWVAHLAGVDCCCEPVQSPEEGLADPGVDAPQAESGGIPMLSAHVGAAPARVDTRVPKLGADGRQVMKELGIDPEVVEKAIAAKALWPGEPLEA